MTEDAKLLEWIENIIFFFNVMYVYKFSKFLYGCVMLFYLNEVLLKLFYWYGVDANECVVDVSIESSRGDVERLFDYDGMVYDIECMEFVSLFIEFMCVVVVMF